MASASSSSGRQQRRERRAAAAAATSTAVTIAPASPSARRVAARPGTDGPPVLTRHNYVLLGLCLGLIVAGYVLMRMENEVDGFISLNVSPLLLLAGYLGIVYAFLWRPRRAAADVTPVSDAAAPAVVDPAV